MARSFAIVHICFHLSQHWLISNGSSLADLTKLQLRELLEVMEATHPLLKDQLHTLSSSVLPDLIEHKRLPARRLKIELFSESQVTAGELASLSLRELFEFCDDSKERAA